MSGDVVSTHEGKLYIILDSVRYKTYGDYEFYFLSLFIKNIYQRSSASTTFTRRLGYADLFKNQRFPLNPFPKHANPALSGSKWNCIKWALNNCSKTRHKKNGIMSVCHCDGLS